MFCRLWSLFSFSFTLLHTCCLYITYFCTCDLQTFIFTWLLSALCSSSRSKFSISVEFHNILAYRKLQHDELVKILLFLHKFRVTIVWHQTTRQTAMEVHQMLLWFVRRMDSKPNVLRCRINFYQFLRQHSQETEVSNPLNHSDHHHHRDLQLENISIRQVVTKVNGWIIYWKRMKKMNWIKKKRTMRRMRKFQSMKCHRVELSIEMVLVMRQASEYWIDEFILITNLWMFIELWKNCLRKFYFMNENEREKVSGFVAEYIFLNWNIL